MTKQEEIIVNLVRVLLAVEWVRHPETDQGDFCLSCDRWRWRGEMPPGHPSDIAPGNWHADDCALDAALRKAGLPRG